MLACPMSRILPAPWCAWVGCSAWAAATTATTRKPLGMPTNKEEGSVKRPLLYGLLGSFRTRVV